MKKNIHTPKSTTVARSGSIIMLPISEGACSIKKKYFNKITIDNILVGIDIYVWHAHIF